MIEKTVAELQEGDKFIIPFSDSLYELIFKSKPTKSRYNGKEKNQVIL